jgi:hypothetical protein
LSLLFLDFFYDFYSILQGAGPNHKTGNNLFTLQTLELLNFSHICPRFLPPQARRRWQARRRRGGARPGKQATGIIDWTHLRLIGGGGPAGEVAGEWRRRRRRGAAAGTRTTVREGAGLNHVLHGELPCGLGKALGRSPGLENRRRGELDGGGPAAAAGARAPASR